MKIKNPRVVILSIIALGFLVLTFLVDWVFMIPVLIILYLNQKELMRKKSSK